MRGVINDRYTVLRTLGSGGFGEVFLARDGVLGREVALKVLGRRCADDGGGIERFRREACSAASLSHPNVVAVHDFGQDPEDGAPYIVMEYVPGVTLADVLKGEGALAPGSAAAVALGVASGLEAAHRRGVVHRDVKPANVLLAGAGAFGTVKVADFGVARVVAEDTLTEENAVVGTAHYLSPEQAMGRPAGPASDLYSLGVVLYEMLAGRRPFEAEGAESPLAVAMRHVTEEPDPPSASNPEVPPALDALVMRLLAKNPERRPASAAVLAELLAKELGRMDGSAAGGRADSKSSGIGADDRTVGMEGHATELRTSRISPSYEAPCGERAERGEGGGGTLRRRGRRRGRLRFATTAATLLFVVLLAASAGALGGERLQAAAGWVSIVPPGPGTTDSGGEARAGQAAAETADGGPSGVKDDEADARADARAGAGARRAAVEYYEAVDRESWAYTYGKLDSQSREMFTEAEWQRRNRWFADNEGLELASMEVDATGLSASGTHAEVNVRRTFENGVVIDRDTDFVLEESTWKHRLVGRELFLFMPGATYGEFVEAR